MAHSCSLPGPQMARLNAWGLDDLKAGLSWANGPSTHMQTLQMAWAPNSMAAGFGRRESREQTSREHRM